MLILSIGSEPIITPSVAGFYVADFVNGIYYVNGVLSSEIDVVTDPSMIIGGKGLVVRNIKDAVYQPGFLTPAITDKDFSIIVEYEIKGLVNGDGTNIIRLTSATGEIDLYHGYGFTTLGGHISMIRSENTTSDLYFDLQLPQSGRHIAAFSKSENNPILTLAIDGGYSGHTTLAAITSIMTGASSIVYSAGDNVELTIRHLRILPFVFSENDLLNISRFSTPHPSNDDFANATTISNGDTLSGTVVAATKEIGEPSHDSLTGGCSTWWQIDATEDGTYGITLSGADVTNFMQPLIAVYTGTRVDLLGSVAASSGTTLSFSATAGTTYYVAVDDQRGPTCGADYDINLAFTPTVGGVPPNDNFANAIAMHDGDTHTQTNVGASSEPGEQFDVDFAPSGGASGMTIWYKYTATVTGTVTFDTHGSEVDTLLTVWTGSALGSLVEVIHNDNDPADTTFYSSIVSFSATAGTTYYIQLDTWAGYEGNIRFNVNRGLAVYPPPPDMNSYIDNDVIYAPRTGNLYPPLIAADDLMFSPYTFNQTIFDAATVNAVSLSGGDLVATNTGTTSTSQHVDATKVIESGAGTNNYFEIQFTTIAGGASMRMGLRQSGTFGSGSQITVYSDGSIHTATSTWGHLGTINEGDWIAVATVFEAGGAGVGTYFRNVTQNGPWNGISGATAPDEFNSAPTGSFVNYVPFVAFGGTGGVAGSVFTANFGGSPFQGAIPAPRHQTSRPDNAPFAPGWF